MYDRNLAWVEIQILWQTMKSVSIWKKKIWKLYQMYCKGIFIFPSHILNNTCMHGSFINVLLSWSSHSLHSFGAMYFLFLLSDFFKVDMNVTFGLINPSGLLKMLITFNLFVCIHFLCKNSGKDFHCDRMCHCACLVVFSLL